MSHVTIYIYCQNGGNFLRSRAGSTEAVMLTTEANSEEFTLTPPPDSEHVWRWVDDKWVADELEAIPIEELQASVWSNIKDKRNVESSKSILLESVNKMFQTDFNSMAEYNNIASMIALDNYDPIEWKTEDNSFILLTVELFRELQKAISINTQRLFKVAEEHKEAMLNMSDPMEYDYSEGWV